MRTCGPCTVCCYIGEVPELGKGPHTLCPHQGVGCGIFGQPERPMVCSGFGCAWLRELLPEDARPDRIGVMFSLNFTERGVVALAIEAAPGALETTAREALVHLAHLVKCPIIVSSFESKPPEDRGDFVVVRDELAPRARAIIGEILWREGDVGVYRFRRAA